MLQILPTKDKNSDELVRILAQFAWAAKKYVASGIFAKYPRFKEEETLLARVWNRRRGRAVRADFQRAFLGKNALEANLVVYVKNIVSHPDVAITARDSFFRELGVLETLAHCPYKRNIHADAFDKATSELCEAIQNDRFIRSVSYAYLQKKLCVPPCVVR